VSRGGPRARSGPPPDPNALRRDRDKDAAGWVALPAEGRVGDAPDWPLSDPSEREVTVWLTEWTRPQAVMWELNHQELEVAMYVRTLVGAESRQSTAAERTLLLRQQEYLGVSVPGLARNRWRIGDQGKSTESEGAGVRRMASARDRLKVINGGEA
jgi:hypothetical protein